MKKSIAKSILFGIAVGDALGVPVEFKPRSIIACNPVNDMLGFGTHHQPTGTWSDDSSLAFCLADSLCNGYNLKDIADKFVKWYDDGLWTPHGTVFDIGITTRNAIHNIKRGIEPSLAGESSETSNGNGSLMRILPLLVHINGLTIDERFRIIGEVSSLTHRHPRSILGCILLLEYARILQHKDPKQGLMELSLNIPKELVNYLDLQNEMVHYSRLLDGMNHNAAEDLLNAKTGKHQPLNENDDLMPSIASAHVDDIKSSGYVVATLEASIWCLINSSCYEEAVLMAVNLGGDTDTTGAVTGGLAGIYYGFEAIPKKWMNQLARKDDIEVLAERLENSLL
jgi:ADP-ribosylglycohydrolase